MKDLEPQTQRTRTRSPQATQRATSSALEMLDAIQANIDKRRDRKSMIRMFDAQGKKEVTEANIRSVLDTLGFSYEDKDAKIIYQMANPTKEGLPNTADIYKLLSNEHLQKQFRDKTSFEDIRREFEQHLAQSKRRGVMSVITNDIKKVHKQLISATENGFVSPDKAKKILRDSAKKWDAADLQVIDQIVDEQAGPHGVDSQVLLELVADRKLRMRIDIDQIKEKHASLEQQQLRVFDSKVSDNTIKPSFHRLEAVEAKRHPLQNLLINKFADKRSLETALQSLAGEGQQQINREKLFEFYRQATSKERLASNDRQHFYKFTENLRFREDDAKIDIADFADLVFGHVASNNRLKENARYLHPAPPSDPQTDELEHSPDKRDFRMDHHPTLHSSSFLPEVKQSTRDRERRLKESEEQTDSDPSTVKRLADKLEFALNSKVSNSYEMFKFFDKDNDGLIKRREFQSKLADIGLCTDHQAGQLFDRLKNGQRSKGLNYTEFHAGFSQMQDPKGPVTYSPGNPTELFAGTRSVGSKRSIQQPLSVAEFKRDQANKHFYHDTMPITAAVKDSGMYMDSKDRFSRDPHHREYFIRQEKQRREQLLQERVVNKSQVLGMYEDLRHRADLKAQQKEASALQTMQHRQQLYSEVIKLSEKPTNL